MGKKILIVAIVLALIGGLVWWFMMRQGADNAAIVNAGSGQQMAIAPTESATGDA